MVDIYHTKLYKHGEKNDKHKYVPKVIFKDVITTETINIDWSFNMIYEIELGIIHR